MQASDEMGKLVCSRILTEKCWDQNFLKLEQPIIQSADYGLQRLGSLTFMTYQTCVRASTEKNEDFLCRMLRLVQILKSRPLACFLLLLTSSLLMSLSTPHGEIIMTVWWSLRNQDTLSFVNFAILVTAPSWLPERNFSKFALIWWSLIKSVRCRWVANPGRRQLGWPRRAASNQVLLSILFWPFWFLCGSNLSELFQWPHSGKAFSCPTHEVLCSIALQR